MPKIMMTDTKGTVPKRRLSPMKSTVPFVTFSEKKRIFAADNVERFVELMVPDSLQPHKKMLKVNLLTRFE